MVTPSRFVDRDAFARFAGIGIGCQRLQASQVLDIQIGKDHAVGGSKPQPDGTGLHTDGLDDGALESDDDSWLERDGSGDDDLGLESE